MQSASLFTGALTDPHGGWTVCSCPDFYLGANPERASCGPSDVNGSTLCSDSVEPGPGVRIPVDPYDGFPPEKAHPVRVRIPAAYSAFVGPMPCHYGGVPEGYMTGSLNHPEFHRNVLRDDSFVFESLDAPSHLASGGVRFMPCYSFSMASHLVSRPGNY